MSPETLAMDHWLVCPADLHRRLKDEFVPLADSQLLDLRLACGAVECVPRLEDLRAKVQVALHRDSPAVRIVLPQLGRAEYEALGSFEPAQAERLHLYDFSARPEDVLGSLCTPEDAVAAALHAADAHQSVPMIVGAGVDERLRQSYADALLQWQQSVTAAKQLEEDDTEAGDGLWGDWETLRLDPQVLQVAPATVAAVEVGRAFGSNQPRAEGSELSLRWTADLDGIAVKVEASLPQPADPEGDVICLTVWLGTRQLPGPDRVILDLGGDSLTFTLTDLRWQADLSDSGRILVRRTEIIDVVDRQVLQSRGNCERIICLWSDSVGSGWWHELEDEQELLLAAGGRIVEAPLAEAAEAIATAVREGYRPVLFVPNPADWPRVCQALGAYRAYARLLVWTRDDEAMRDLLHFPSLEVQEVARTQGTLVVPNAAYGRSLDLLLQVSLGDFVSPEPQEGQQPDQRFIYYSRLNPFRIIELTVSQNATNATLKQYYLSDGGARQPCTLPVLAGENTLVFDSDGHCELAPAQHPVALIVKALRPALWRVEAIWNTLVDRLRDISFLSALQQVLLINAEPPAEAWQRRPLRIRALPVRGFDVAELTPFPSPVLIAVDSFVPAAEGGKPELRLAVRWLPESAKPERPPKVQVFCGDAEKEIKGADWLGDGCQAIAVPGAPDPDPDLKWHGSPDFLDIWLLPAGTAARSSTD